MIPGVNDAPEQVEEILELCGEAGASHVTGIPLHLRGEVREIWFDWLRQYRPDLLPTYEKLYARGAYMPKEESERLTSMVRGRGGIPPAMWRRTGHEAAVKTNARRAERERYERKSTQESLF
jgi:DNA repair photolyase